MWGVWMCIKEIRPYKGDKKMVVSFRLMELMFPNEFAKEKRVIEKKNIQGYEMLTYEEKKTYKRAISRLLLA